MKKPTKNTRTWTLVLKDGFGNESYLYRTATGDVTLVSKSEIPLALANIAPDAARCRFELENAQDATTARTIAAQYCAYAKVTETL